MLLLIYMLAAIAVIAVAASVVDIEPVVVRSLVLIVEDMHIVVHLPDRFLVVALVLDTLAGKADRAAVKAGSTGCLAVYRVAVVVDSRVAAAAGC